MAEKNKKLIELDIVTPERTMVADHVEQVNAPGIAVLTVLRPGTLSYQKGQEMVSMVISGGYLEVAENRVIVLAETAEFLKEIDRDRAAKAKSQAEGLLEKTDLADPEFKEAQLKLFRAVARLEESSEE